MPYYEIVDCVWRGEDRWHLQEPACPDGSKPFTWSFRQCQPFRPDVRLRVAVQQEGKPVDFTFAAFDIPVLSPRAVDVLSPRVAEFCEFIPVEVDGQSTRFCILNALRAEDCVDENASELVIWKSSDARPDKAGHYRQISRLVLKPDLCGPPIFRLAKFKVTLLVNAAVAELFRKNSLSGVVLEER